MNQTAQTRETYSQRLLKGGGYLAWQRFARFRAAADAVQRYAYEAMRRDMLDIGAADGIGLPFLKPLSDRLVSVNYYDNHTREFQAAHPGEEVITADARDLRLPDGSFDIVVSFETLHLIPVDRLKAIAEIHRVLRPGGLLVCSVPIEIGHTALLKLAARAKSGHQLDGMSLGMALKHVFPSFFNITQYDRGRQVGFDAYRFSRDIGPWFDVLERKAVPLPILLPFNLLIVARRKEQATP
ncbi:class I SAM-dependent methyltransferase [Thiocapsa rosea]|uniref:Methyltransferase family protein n=1 Tax=Thiocapsa rosea TaxID=69360 RepID=A0A495V8E1_9GAMM|nr:class I SAM-dependent methyltransferase [Thiocapsa rosea]RKT45579.1 methyltransferase family protein [Thiocapsa rosea]